MMFTSGVAVLSNQDHYKYKCCGFIYKWTYIANNTGTLTAQVWRHDSGDVYTLVGSNTLKASNPGHNEDEIISNGERIRTDIDDYIGFHSMDSNIILHGNATGNFMKLSGIISTMTTPTDWSSASTGNGSYAIKSWLTPSNAPVVTGFTNITLYNDEISVGDTVNIITTSDDDLEDVNNLTLTINSTDNSGQNYFEIYSSTGAIQIKSIPPTNTYNLDIEVKDPCSLSNIGTQTIIIKNRLPVIVNLPSTISVSEDLVGNTLLFTINATDTNTDPLSCSMYIGDISVFQVNTIASTTDYGVYTANSGITFNYDNVSTYNVTIKCDDGDDTVYGAPVIMSLPGSISLLEDVNTNTLLHTLNVTDIEGDNITCVLNPNSPLFEVSLNPPSNIEYGIYLKGGTNLDYDTTSLYSMTVECGDARRNDTGHFTVNLIRNSAPVITSLPDSVNLLEDVNTNTLLHTLNVTDMEGDNITCVINSNSSFFEVTLIPSSNKDYGIYLKGGTNLDYDVTPLYSMNVECNDARRNDTGHFKVYLIRNSAPVIINLPGSVSLLEDVNTNSLLHTLNVTDMEGDNITCVLNSNNALFEVSLIPPSNIEYGIYLKGGTNLDYDINPSYSMTVECSDARRNDTGHFNVHLIRNSVPVIISLPDSVSLLEDVNTNTLLHTLNVTDMEGDNITCVLNPNSSLFEVSLIPPSNIEYGIYLIGGTTLDYESTPLYSLKVQCSDLRRQNTGNFTIDLVRNEAPVIHSLPDSVSLLEDVNTNMLLHTLNVTDIEGDNTTCSLNQNSSFFEVSLISPSVTEYGIYLIGGMVLSYDITPSYLLTVQCSDTRRNNTAHFTVYLVRNMAPIIHNLPESISLSEDVNSNTLLHTLNVTDTEGDNITCLLNTNSSLFEVSLIPPSNTNYGIYLTGGTLLDYDTTPSYILAVECNDLRQNDTDSFTVNLIRNTPPVFNSLPSSTNVSEDIVSRTLLHTLNVTDENSNDNVTCVLNTHTDTFTLETILPSLDYEIYLRGGIILNYAVLQSYLVVIECADRRRNVSNVLTVDIINPNEAPVIQSLPDSVSFLEDVNTKILLHNLNVTDAEGDNITCTLNPNSSLFKVQVIPQTNNEYGIYLKGGTTLDYDTTPSYTLTVQCGDLRRNDTGVFTINLIRNTPPVINSLPTNTNISEEVITKTFVHLLNVTDENSNDTITCLLTVHTDTFSLEKILPTLDYYGVFLKEGIILNFDNIPSYALIIECGDHRRNVTGVLTVDIINPNMAPSISNLPMSCEIPETISTESLLYIIHVTDPSNDTVICNDTSSSTMFYLQPGIEPFETNIYIRPNQALEYDIQRQYKLNIVCADQRRNDSSIFFIYLIRNMPPSLTNLQAKTNISSQATVGQVIYTVLGTDPENDQLLFSLSSTNADEPFQINQLTGAVWLSRPIQTETVPGYELQINITDGMNVVGPKTLSVRITDVNSIPTLINLPTTINVLEGISVGTSIFQPIIQDMDSSDIHILSVSYIPQDGDIYFHVNDTSRRVSTVADIDYETISPKSFLLMISVKDSITESIENLTINIVNVNEPLHFSKKYYAIDAYENTEGFVLQNPYYQYTDDDGDAVQFSLNCGSDTGKLDIDSTTGLLSYSADYDLDIVGTSAQLQCEVYISDNEFKDNAFLNITILDDNDNSPKFYHNEYLFLLQHSASDGAFVGQVEASDKDIGPYGNIFYHVKQDNLNASIFVVSENGTIKLNNSLSDYQEGLLITFTIFCVDTGGKQDTTSVRILIPTTRKEAPVVVQK
ncbi:FAT4 [Mytilus coruscus]|uniref:FAT4 n=1 Tax=Mytilus coruscus TaxID=42192 RepID=A0A6J8B1L7_MYTCO|nr:FAT4 [Mytilus coruscus]